MIELMTRVKSPEAKVRILPGWELLFVGSCFATSIGKKFEENRFRVVVNPYGVMYNPVSILHTIDAYCSSNSSRRIDMAVLTLGTNHVYRDKCTGLIVDNCRKRPAAHFTEEVLSIEECYEALSAAVERLTAINHDVRVCLTVSPIRYAKYGFHGSVLSKAVLLLSVERLVESCGGTCFYFPAYEIMNDELRDYRFYAPDMLHPSPQAVEYIWERFCASFMSAEAMTMIEQWQPISAALSHRPFNPDSAEYQAFLAKTMQAKTDFEERWNIR